MNNKRGSGLISVLLITFILGSLAGVYLQLVSSNYKSSIRLDCTNQAINLAEAGIEESISELQKDKFEWFKDWRMISPNSYYLKTNSLLTNQPKIQSQVRILITDIDTKQPIVYSEANVIRGTVSTTKQIMVKLDYRGLFSAGLLAKNFISFNGNNVYVDSYNSNNGDYDPVSNFNDMGLIATPNGADSIIDIGNADILGVISTGGGDPDIGSGGTITGFDTPNGVKVDPNRVTRDFNTEFPDVDTPDVGTLPNTSYTTELGFPLTTTHYVLENFTANGDKTYTVEGDVIMVVSEDFTISGQAQIDIKDDSTLTVYIKGDMAIGGNGVINESQVPSDLLIFGVSDGAAQKISVGGNGEFYGAIYAPYADVGLNGSGVSGVVQGSIVANTINLNGAYAFHFDEALNDLEINDRPTLLEWVEVESINDRATIKSHAEATEWIKSLVFVN